MRRPVLRPVHRGFHKPLTVGGRLTPAVDRRLFFAAALAGVMTLDLSRSFVVGLAVFGLLYGLALFTRRDPKLLAAYVRAWRLGKIYDEWAHEPFDVRICR